MRAAGSSVAPCSSPSGRMSASSRAVPRRWRKNSSAHEARNHHYRARPRRHDGDAAKQRGIIVTNTPDVLNETVADTALALIMNTVRRFPQSEQYLRGGHWASRGPYPLTADLGGKTLGVLGLGRIGEAIAKRAMACGMKIRYHNRRRKDAPYPYDA